MIKTFDTGLKVAPNSFTIARALRTKAQVIYPRLIKKKNVSVFRYFTTST